MQPWLWRLIAILYGANVKDVADTEKFDEDKLLKYKATYLGEFLSDMNLIGRRHWPPTYGHGYVSIIRYI